jgi:hypothetical protein
MGDPRLAAARRIRGKGRHFRSVLREAEAFAIEPAATNWWDLWHYHPDWSGFGNLSWRFRREYLRAIGLVFGKILDARDRFQTPFQAFISLNGVDAGQDAVYLHTPNPNGTAFPYVPTVEWGIPLPHPELVSLLPAIPFRCGAGAWTNPEPPSRLERYFVLYSPALGESLEQPLIEKKP